MESVAVDTAGDNSRRRTLMSDDKVDTPNLRDFLRIKEDISNSSNSSSNLTGLTLGAVLSYRREGTTTSPVHSNRTLLDIIRDDPYATKQTRKTWKHFKQKLRIKRRRNNPIDDLTRPELSASGSGSGLDRAPVQRNSSRFENLMSTPSASVINNDVEIIEAADESVDENEEGNNAEEEREPEQPVRISLMSLLAETDGSSFMIGAGDEDEDDGRVTGGEVVVGEYNNCCVCMIRHKGSAFIPCGHTFCRLCSRELWVQRGSCPLCNNFIVEILDIF